MSYITEFPSMAQDVAPFVPDLMARGFADESWHNDACPCFVNRARGLRAWIECEDVDSRESGGARFMLQQINPDDIPCPDGSDILAMSDEWPDILRAIDAQG